MKMEMKQWKILLAVFCMLSVTANATLLEVGVGQTYSTIQAAIDASVDADEINIHEGVYSEYVSVVDKMNLNVHSNAGDKVVIDGLSLWNGSSATWSDNNLFEGLWINRTGQGGWAIQHQYARGNIYKDVVIYGNNSGGNGIYGNLQYGLNSLDNVTIYGMDNAYSNGYAAGLHVYDSIIASSLYQPYNHSNVGGGAVTEYSNFGNTVPPTNGLAAVATISSDPLFASTDPSNPHFLWLTAASPSNGTASDGLNMGALPTVPEPASMILLGFGAMAMRIRKRS
jgi:hypothetical protein